MGLVADIFNSEVLARLEGTSAIGHNRYSTTGSTSLKNCQPLVVEYSRGGLALGHNGNLVNFQELRARLEAGGSIFQSSSDSELIIHLIANSQAPDLPTRVTEANRGPRPIRFPPSRTRPPQRRDNRGIGDLCT
jgi:amidophosphoribosyltransferase